MRGQRYTRSRFFRFSGERLAESECFVDKTHLRLRGYHPSKFQIIMVSPFGGVNEQTNKYTDRQTN